MRNSLRAATLSLTFLSLSAAAQQPPSRQPQPVQRDPQAVSIISRAWAVTSWTAFPVDVVAQATVNEFKGANRTTVPVTWKSLGADLSRTEIDSPDGRKTLIRNGGRGAFAESS